MLMIMILIPHSVYAAVRHEPPLSPTCHTCTLPPKSPAAKYPSPPSSPSSQGLTFVHVSAHHKRVLWDRGCTSGLFRGCLEGVRGYQGVPRVYFVSETAQVELNSGRV